MTSIKKYKKSKFNVFFPISDDENLLYNTQLNSLIKIGSNFDSLAFDDNSLNKLHEMGFLVENHVNEINELVYSSRKWKFNDGNFSIAILPNMDCNFRCGYCYQELGNNYMQEKTIKAIELFISKQIKNNNINSLGVTWFGGEPLLSKNIIERLSKSFSRVENYNANLITNGYALTDSFINKLQELGINLVHFTLDGPKEIHDKYRYLKNGKGTYDIIKSNIEKIINKYGDKISVNIRTNLNQDNIDGFESLVEDFKNYKGANLSFLFRKICKLDSGQSKDFDSILSNSDYNEISFKAMAILVKYGFRKPFDYLPQKKIFQSCYVGLLNGLSIAPDGSLYKCYTDVNPPKEKLGEILPNGELKINRGENLKWIVNGFEDNQKCQKCNLLPLCITGCPKSIVNNLPCNKIEKVNELENTIKQVYNLQNEIK